MHPRKSNPFSPSKGVGELVKFENCIQIEDDQVMFVNAPRPIHRRLSLPSKLQSARESRRPLWGRSRRKGSAPSRGSQRTLQPPLYAPRFPGAGGYFVPGVLQ